MDQVVVFGVLTVANAVLLFVAMFLSGLRTNALGLAIFAVSMATIDMVSPNIWIAIGIGTVVLWILTTQLTSADGVIDVLFFVLMLNLVTVTLIFVLLPRIMEHVGNTGVTEAPL
jgi:hypothetical protein